MNQPLLILTLTAAACTALPAAIVLPPGEYLLTGAMQSLEGNRGGVGFPDTTGTKYSAVTVTGTDRTAVIALTPTSSDFYLNYTAAALDINGAAPGTGLTVASYRYVEIHYTLSADFVGSTQQLRLQSTVNAADFDTFTGSSTIPSTAGTHSIVIDLLSDDGTTLNGRWSGEWELLRWDFWNNSGNQGKSFTIDKVVYAPSVVRLLDRPAGVVMDAGGGRAAGGIVVNDGSLGGIVGISSAGATVAKHGYIGQLTEVTALQLAATPMTVNETATRQLSATQVLDDNSLNLLPATAVTWSVASGPLTAIDTNGLATAATVYQNTAATAQATYAGNTGTLGLTVLDTIPDNFGSYAGDGLADDWQFDNFGLDNPLAGPLLDPDGDGQNNAFEEVAGLDPNNPLSRFLVTIAPVSGQPAQKQVVFDPVVAGRSYTVMTSPDLTAGSWVDLVGGSVTNNGDQRSVTDTAASETKKFYTVEIVKP